MSRLRAIEPQKATGKAKELLNAVQSKMQAVPNMTRVMANSPAVLEAYLAFSGTLAGTLNPTMREEIALAVSEANGCEYCVSAHTAISKAMGLTGDEIERAREGESYTEKNQAAMTFARQVVAKRGQLTQADVDAIRAAGFSDGEIAEVLGNVALNLFTNYFNIAAQVENDFPKVTRLREDKVVQFHEVKRAA